VEKRGRSAADLVIAGRLTLHGVTGSLKVPVHVELAAETLTRGVDFK
jgi:polyisoprenoid-binding protein YceI